MALFILIALVVVCALGAVYGTDSRPV